MPNLGASVFSEKELANKGFKSLGANVKISDRASLYGIENISIGNNVRIDDFVIIIATGPVYIGNFVSIHNFCFLGGRNNIVIKDFVTFAPGVKIFTASDDYLGDKMTGVCVPSSFTGGSKGKVIIEKHVIIGAGSVIMPKIIVAEGCSVGALSFVNKDLDSWGVYAGVPAKRLKDRKKTVLHLEQSLIKN